MRLINGWNSEKGSWAFEVLSALRKFPRADVHISAILSLYKINMSVAHIDGL